jgi:hypothetical protein
MPLLYWCQICFRILRHLKPFFTLALDYLRIQTLLTTYGSFCNNGTYKWGWGLYGELTEDESPPEPQSIRGCWGWRRVMFRTGSIRFLLVILWWAGGGKISKWLHIIHTVRKENPPPTSFLTSAALNSYCWRKNIASFIIFSFEDEIRHLQQMPSLFLQSPLAPIDILIIDSIWKLVTGPCK